MTILYVLDYGTVGGATHSFLELVDAMRKRGVKPIVCLGGGKTDITNILDSKQIDYVFLKHRTVLDTFSFKNNRWPYIFLKKYLLYWLCEIRSLHLLKKIDWSQIDLIHTNSARNDIGCFINKKYGVPHLMHIREFGDVDFGCISFRCNYIDIFNKYTSTFISISDAVKNHWTRKGICKEKIQTIYNGIRYDNISISSDKDKNSSIVRLLIAGGVCEPKGQLIAVQALSYLPKEIQNYIRLDIAGWYDNKYLSKIKKYAESEEILDKINILGSINDVHERMGNYQIGLMCSHAEGFGRVTAEYMHGRLGVIASDSGANPELIEDGITGLLFKSGDAHSLANSIIRLYNDRELLIRLSTAAQKKARAMYTQDKNAESVYNLYKQILNN